ncbi:hypothetical protein [Streptomyces sp. NPDC052496]|uniref:hypothetical protein n=1 Tax=Streptomyces sp. NPDC052496 TaxID=3154951 RepID=UPI0034291147
MVVGEQQGEWVTVVANRPERYHWVLAGVIVGVGLPAGLLSGSVDLLVAAGTALVCVLVLARIGHACSVTVTGQEVRRRGVFGRTRRIPRGDIATVLHAPHLDLGNNQRADWLALLDGHGRPLLRLSSQNIWPRAGIERLRDAVGGPTVRTVPIVRMPHAQARTVRERFPLAMPYRVAHPNIFGCAFAALLVAGIAAGVIIFAVLNP